MIGRSLGWMIAILLLATAAWGVWHTWGIARPPVDAIVVRALLREESKPYTATACLTMPEAKKKIKSTVSLIHSPEAEIVTCPCSGNGAAWTIKKPDCSYTYIPASGVMVISRYSSLLTADQRGRLLLANYGAEYKGKSRVAGREAYVIDLAPRHGTSPGKKVWIDIQNETVLRSVDRSSTGGERGMEITSISYGAPVDRAAFTPRPKAGTKTIIGCEPSSLAELSHKIGVTITEPRYVPSGYAIEGRHFFTPPCGCCPSSAQITYTDGLNTISVFENRAGSECKSGCCGPETDKSGRCRVACCGVTGSGRITRGNKKVVVVADLPASEIRKIAESVE